MSVIIVTVSASLMSRCFAASKTRWYFLSCVEMREATFADTAMWLSPLKLRARNPKLQKSGAELLQSKRLFRNLNGRARGLLGIMKANRRWDDQTRALFQYEHKRPTKLRK